MILTTSSLLLRRLVNEARDKKIEIKTKIRLKDIKMIQRRRVSRGRKAKSFSVKFSHYRGNDGKTANWNVAVVRGTKPKTLMTCRGKTWSKLVNRGRCNVKVFPPNNYASKTSSLFVHKAWINRWKMRKSHWSLPLDNIIINNEKTKLDAPQTELLGVWFVDTRKAIDDVFVLPLPLHSTRCCVSGDRDKNVIKVNKVPRMINRTPYRPWTPRNVPTVFANFQVICYHFAGVDDAIKLCCRRWFCSGQRSDKFFRPKTLKKTFFCSTRLAGYWNFTAKLAESNKQNKKNLHCRLPKWRRRLLHCLLVPCFVCLATASLFHHDTTVSRNLLSFRFINAHRTTPKKFNKLKSIFVSWIDEWKWKWI